MRCESVVFDLDGTLLDTLDDLHAAANHALRAFGFPARSLDEVRMAVGNGLINLVRRTVPEGTPEALCQDVLVELNRYYAVHCEDRTGPYGGVPEMLSALKGAGLHVAVVSNKGDYAVQELMPHYFAGLYETCVGEREGIRRKPAPDSTLEALRRMGAEASGAVYVGDSDVDVQTAGNAGLPCISVTWGFRSEAFLRAHGATELAHSPAELTRMLLAGA